MGTAASTELKTASRTWRRRSLGIAAAIVVPALLVIVVEAGLRLFGVGYDPSLTAPCTVQGKPAACYNLFFPAPFFPPGMIKTPQAYAIPVVKPPQTFRIVVLGESAAMGDPDPAYGFSRYLEVMLRERFPAANFEIINTGSVAINSHVSLLIAKDLARRQPDFVISYSGNNEVVGPYGPGTALTGSAMSLPVIRASIFVRSTRIGQLLTKLGTPKKEWGGMEMFLDKQIPASSTLLKPTYSNFAGNLRDTIAVSRQAGAMVIVSTVATNLKDCAPFASAHREGLAPDALRNWETLVQRGAEMESARSYAEAVAAYRQAEQIDDQYAELEFRIARCLWMLGDYGAAGKQYQRARDLDTLRFRADSQINEVNRSVASSSGAQLVDAEKVFSEESPNGIVGSELVYEHVHMTPRGNYVLARAMFGLIAPKVAAKTGQQATGIEPLREEECEQLLALTGYDRARLATEMLQRLQKPPFTNQLTHNDQALRLSMKARLEIESPDTTAAEYQWALRKKPDDRILHYNFGLFLFDHDQRAAAAEQLRMSRPWDGFPVFAPDGSLVE